MADERPVGSSEAKCFLGGVDHVEEAVFVTFALIQLRHGHRNAGHAALVDEQEERLVGVELHAPPV